MGVALSNPDLSQNADHLRGQMRSIRRDLGDDVEVLVENAERLLDWRYYVQRHPWAAVGVAAVLGYFIVPRRIVTLPTDERSMTQLAERIAPAIAPPQPKQPGLLSGLVSLASGVLLRAALGYATQHVGKLLNRQTMDLQPEEIHHG